MSKCSYVVYMSVHTLDTLQYQAAYDMANPSKRVALVALKACPIHLLTDVRVVFQLVQYTCNDHCLVSPNVLQIESLN